ncbi:hypothetical protein [Streptomyces sp. NPDC015131]|uniref:hypothetical protein n=1 Tax=Streptomyces sp. NPDC015131 TaxID=3364941 RepID=UPI0036F9B4C6
MVTDARGVEIEAGDTAIFFGVIGRSVALAEGVVLGSERCSLVCAPADHGTECDGGASGCRSVSLTLSGRVRLRVVWRSDPGAGYPIAYVRPDRLVVLKPCDWAGDDNGPLITLPPSPLPTQGEASK